MKHLVPNLWVQEASFCLWGKQNKTKKKLAQMMGTRVK